MNKFNLTEKVKKLIPVTLKVYLNGIFYGWHGNYSTWKAASEKCAGYDSEIILRKVTRSSLIARDDNAVYERDSVVFNELQYSFPLLSSLMWIAARKGGSLNIIDFGGSLGSSYYQNRRFLESLPQVNWCIVEQPEFVRAGLAQFRNDNLHFYNNVNDCFREHRIDAILFSSVLQYLEHPYELVREIVSRNIEFIIIDRTPFVSGKQRLTVQKVNPKIYNASYPCWFFNKTDFLALFSDRYELVIEFDSLDKSNIRSEFKGFLFENRS